MKPRGSSPIEKQCEDDPAALFLYQRPVSSSSIVVRFLLSEEGDGLLPLVEPCPDATSIPLP